MPSKVLGNETIVVSFSRLNSFFQQWVIAPKLYSFLVSPPPGIEIGASPTPLSPAGKKPATLREIQMASPREIVWVSVENLRLWGRAFTPNQQQLVRYFRDGLGSLKRFYDLHQPTNQIEAIFLDPNDVGGFTPVAPSRQRLPWSWERNRTVTPEFGPVSQAQVDLEASRLDLVRDSVERYGFLGQGHGSIKFGEILVDDTRPHGTDFRVLVHTGFHRVSLLAFLGWPLIPMAPKQSLTPRDIRLSSVSSWPGVLDGNYSESAAIAFFLAYFRDPLDTFLPDW